MSTSTTSGARYRTRRLRQYLINLWDRREFAWYLAAGNIKARNASTALGLFWWVLNPLLLGMVYFLVFGILFGDRRPDDYVAYLLSGMFVFHFTHQSMTGGANSILQNTKLLANLKFPRMVLLISAVIESGIGFAGSLFVFYTISIAASGIYPSLSTLWLAAAIPIHVMMNLGLAAFVARIAVPFRDITNFLPYATRLWLYVSPVIWPLSMLEEAGGIFDILARVNPMFQLIGFYRVALMGTPFDPSALMGSLFWASVIFISGSAAFVTYENRIVRYL